MIHHTYYLSCGGPLKFFFFFFLVFFSFGVMGQLWVMGLFFGGPSNKKCDLTLGYYYQNKYVIIFSFQPATFIRYYKWRTVGEGYGIKLALLGTHWEHQIPQKKKKKKIIPHLTFVPNMENVSTKNGRLKHNYVFLVFSSCTSP